MAEQLRRLRDNHIADGLEFLLPGERRQFRHLVLIGADDIRADVVPEPVGSRYARVPRQLVHDLIHHGPDRCL